MPVGQKQPRRRKEEKREALRSVVPLREATSAASTSPSTRAPPVLPGQCSVLRGVLAGLSTSGEAFVDFEGNDSGAAVAAEATVELQPEHVGHDVTLVFLDDNPGYPSKPVVSGVLRAPASGRLKARRSVTLSLDGERLTLSAERELVLRCGKASITMRSDGTIELNGTNLLSRSSGSNRIRGGSVSLN